MKFPSDFDKISVSTACDLNSGNFADVSDQCVKSKEDIK